MSMFKKGNVLQYIGDSEFGFFTAVTGKVDSGNFSGVVVENDSGRGAWEIGHKSKAWALYDNLWAVVSEDRILALPTVDFEFKDIKPGVLLKASSSYGAEFVIAITKVEIGEYDYIHKAIVVASNGNDFCKKGSKHTFDFRGGRTLGWKMVDMTKLREPVKKEPELSIEEKITLFMSNKFDITLTGAQMASIVMILGRVSSVEFDTMKRVQMSLSDELVEKIGFNHLIFPNLLEIIPEDLRA